MDAAWHWPQSVYGWAGIATRELLFIPPRNDCKAGRSEPEPARRLPSSLPPKHTNHPTALRLPFEVTPCAGQQGTGRAQGSRARGAQQLWGKGSRAGLSHPPGPRQPEATNWWLPSTLCSAISVPGSAAQAVLATLPCGFILTRGQGRAGCWQPSPSWCRPADLCQLFLWSKLF